MELKTLECLFMPILFMPVLVVPVLWERSCFAARPVSLARLSGETRESGPVTMLPASSTCQAAHRLALLARACCLKEGLACVPARMLDDFTTSNATPARSARPLSLLTSMPNVHAEEGSALHEKQK